MLTNLQIPPASFILPYLLITGLCAWLTSHAWGWVADREARKLEQRQWEAYKRVRDGIYNGREIS